MKRLPALLFFLSCLILLAQNDSTASWLKAEELFPGILHLKLERSEPRLQQIHLIRIDMNSRRYSFVSTPKPAEWNQEMPGNPDWRVVTRTQTTVDFMKEMRARKKAGGRGLDVILAVNASPWSPFPPKPSDNPFAAGMGLYIANGLILDSNDLGRPSFVVMKNGSLDFRTASNPIRPEDIYISLPGFSVILEKGRVTPWADGDKSVHPRTGYGLSKDRRYFFILVVDGRQQDYSIGQTTGEMAVLLKAYGAYDALNMDGGGSTTLVRWSKRSDKRDRNNPGAQLIKGPHPVIMNRPSGGALRRDGNNLGIIRK